MPPRKKINEKPVGKRVRGPAGASKSTRRPAATHLLILECEAEKLAGQRLDLGSKAAAFLRALFPKKKIVLVKTSDAGELGRALADALESYGRFRTILVVGHSNELGLKLTTDRGFGWEAVARWLGPFSPEYLLLAACQAGKFRAAKELFAGIKSLREIYASPVKMYGDQTNPLIGLLVTVLKSRKIDEDYFRILQAAGYVLSDGLLYRWGRGEVLRGDEAAGTAWNVVGDLLNKRV
jgi:hypothetical protein